MPPATRRPSRRPGPLGRAACLLAIAGVVAPAAAAPGSAEWLSIERYDASRGLSQTTVTAMLEDPKGFLWVGTQEGLNRFDGHRFEVFLHDPDDPSTLPSSSVDALLWREPTTMWIGTNDAGLVAWDLEANRRTRVGPEQGLAHLTVAALAADGHGGAWLLSPEGVDHVDAELAVTTVLREPGLVALASHGDRALAMAADCRLHELRRDAPPRPIAAAQDPGCTTLLASADALWLGRADGGLVQLSNSGEVQRHVAPVAGGASPDVSALGRLADGRLLVGDDGGRLFELVPAADATLAPVTLDDPLDQRITAFYQGTEGVIWIGTKTRGLLRVRLTSSALRRDLVPEAQQRAWPSRSLRAIWRSGGTTLVGTDLGLVRRDGDDAPWREVDALPRESMRVILREGDGFWIGTHDGLWRLGDDGTASRVDGLGAARVSALLPAGDGLWVATRRGLFRLRDGRPDPGAVPDALREAFLTSLLRDSDGRIWIGSNELGLFRLDPDGSLHRRTAAEGGLRHDSVWSLHETADAIWAGTFSGGLQRIDRGDGSLRVYDRNDGFANDVIYRIEEDGDGRLWLSTNSGLAVLDPASDVVQTLHPGDGLYNHEYNAGASFADADGLLWFGGIDGLDVVDPAGLGRRSLPARPVVAALHVLGRGAVDAEAPERDLAHAAYLESLQLGHRDSALAVELAAIDFSAPESARLRWRIPSLDPEWVPLQRPSGELLLSALPPGSHRLEIEAAGRDGRFVRSQALRLEVAPPPWRHPLAWAGYGAAVLLAMLLVAWRVRERALAKTRQIALLNRTVAERTAALEQANQRLHETNARLETAIRTDPLTGVANRREFEEWLAREQQRLHAAGRGGALVFCMIDIDDFKQINDRHGHAVGDGVLVAVAQRLRGVCRAGDLLVRWGGEEFLLALRDAGPEGLAGLGERVRRAVTDQPIRLDDGSVHAITCSAGIAPWPVSPAHPEHGSWERSIDLADLALYEAKHAGKNAWVALRARADADAAVLAATLARGTGTLDPQAIERLAGPARTP